MTYNINSFKINLRMFKDYDYIPFFFFKKNIAHTFKSNASKQHRVLHTWLYFYNLSLTAHQNKASTQFWQIWSINRIHHARSRHQTLAHLWIPCQNYMALSYYPANPIPSSKSNFNPCALVLLSQLQSKRIFLRLSIRSMLLLLFFFFASTSYFDS